MNRILHFLSARRPAVLLVLAALVLVALPAGVTAAPGEDATFRAAERAFRDGLYDRAEREFGDFLDRFPKSSKAGEAILFQAQSRFHLKNFAAAAAELREHLPRAGRLADRYQFWLAESLYHQGDYTGSAAEYARLLAAHPGTSRQLEAAYGQAMSLFQLGRHGEVLQLLQPADGIFQKAVNGRADHELALRGLLLLGEAQLASKQLREAAETVQLLSQRKLPPEPAWRRLHLLCRVQLAGVQLDAARESVEALVALTPENSPGLAAEGWALKGLIHERLGQPEQAIAAFERNFAEGVSAERRREALLRVIELLLPRAKPADAIRKLEQFLETHPQDGAADLARVTVGELWLKEHYMLAAAARTNAAPELVTQGTNALAQAFAQFDRLLTATPDSAQAGRAFLQRGWCRWESGAPADSAADFQAAAERLPPSEEQAIAVFKWADAQFIRRDFGGALTNYQRVVRDFAGLPRVKSTLFDQALYQTVHAAIAVGDVQAADEAVRNILAWYPESFFSDRSLLLAGQAFTRHSRLEDARRLFADFLKRFPDSTLAPDARLALARTQMREGNWTDAIGIYEEWLRLHAGNGSRPRAEFDLAWLQFRAGNETNALNLFTNFLARFPTNSLAPLAQNWVADFHFRQGEYHVAELNYQLLYQNTNWPVTELTYQARMMAGRMAVARQGFAEARGYFTNLVNISDPRCPTNLQVQALFALGDTYIEEARDLDAMNSLKRYEVAINAFSLITNRFPDSPLLPHAFGQIANCHLQLASQDPRRYDTALELYQLSFDAAKSNLFVRCLARIGAGTTLEKKAATRPTAEQANLLRQARDSYLDVVYYEKIAPPGEVPDPAHVKEAGLAAGRLYEQGQQFGEAIRVYETLGRLLPSLRPVTEKRIRFCREQAGAPPAAPRPDAKS